MKALLDTHAVLWWLFDDPQLSARARKLIAAAENDAVVSSASAWEISIKHRLGKLPKAGDVPTRLPAYLRKARLPTLSTWIPGISAPGFYPRCAPATAARARDSTWPYMP
jgi:PIN domain nuclease of toxin-antitoxin system